MVYKITDLWRKGNFSMKSKKKRIWHVIFWRLRYTKPGFDSHTHVVIKVLVLVCFKAPLQNDSKIFGYHSFFSVETNPVTITEQNCWSYSSIHSVFGKKFFFYKFHNFGEKVIMQVPYMEILYTFFGNAKIDKLPKQNFLSSIKVQNEFWIQKNIFSKKVSRLQKVFSSTFLVFLVHF